MNNLLGLWMVDPESKPEQIVTMEFKEDGQLIYTVFGSETDNIILLTYHIENDVIITNQPSAPKIEKTKFSFTSEGKLILTHNDQTHQYIRVPSVNP